LEPAGNGARVGTTTLEPTHPPPAAGDAVRAWRWWLAGVILVAVAVRVAIIVTTPHVALFGDPVDYQRHAVSIASGHGYPTTEIATPGTPSAFRPPAYPYVLGGLYALVGVHLLAARLLSALLGVLTVALMAYLGRAIWGHRVGLVAGGLTAIFLPLAALNVTLLSESLFLPLELALACCLLMCVRDPRRIRWVLFSGLLCGLAALTRVVADLWLAPAIVLVITSSERPQALRRTAALIAVFVATLAPWTIRNAVVLHAFVPVSTEGGYTMAGKYNSEAAEPDALEAVWRVPFQVPNVARSVAHLYARPGGVNEAQLDKVLRDDALDYVAAHPHVVAASLWLDTLRLLDLGKAHTFVTSVSYRELGLPGWLQRPATISAQLIAALALLALLARLLRRMSFPLGPAWLWALPLLAALVTVPFGGNPRKRLPLDPFLILLASLMVCTIFESVRHSRSRTDPHIPN
jgi:4-amino-4-deoxy-L-arabinose transferase-like glycosyltransferase